MISPELSMNFDFTLFFLSSYQKLMWMKKRIIYNQKNYQKTQLTCVHMKTLMWMVDIMIMNSNTSKPRRYCYFFSIIIQKVNNYVLNLA